MVNVRGYVYSSCKFPFREKTVQRLFISAAQLAIFTVSFYLQVKAEKKKLLIHALIPQNNLVFSADGLIPAAQIAVEDVNNNASLLPDYELMMEISDSKVIAVHISVVIIILQ